MNAIMFAAKKGISVDGAILYSTVFPCQHCLKNIVQSGIISVIYINDYDLGQYD
jgi:dCMP deaminase